MRELNLPGFRVVEEGISKASTVTRKTGPGTNCDHAEDTLHALLTLHVPLR